MTALAGLWLHGQRSGELPDCTKMLASQAIYGPDSGKHWSDGEIAIGRQLKRVLPEDAYDRQPIVSRDSRYAMVADVRIDNRSEVLRSLNIPERDANSLSDAIVLFGAFERWGINCLQRIIGDFAFIVWNRKKKELILARDHLGQRPLLFHRGNNFFAVASMVKGLHCLSEVPYELDEDCIVESFLSPPQDKTETFYRGIERVLPAHFLVVTKNSISSHSYWSPRPRRLGGSSSKEYVEGLREALDTAVACRFRGAGKEVGAELSGGLDSSVIVATAARLLSNKAGRIIAFTAVPRPQYDGPVPYGRFADEGPHAAAVARLYPNIEHKFVRASPKPYSELLDRHFFFSGGALSGLCNAPWGDELFNSAKNNNLRVLFNGNFGNTSISYNGFELLGELFSSGRWDQLIAEAFALMAKGKMQWRGIMAQTLGPWCPMTIWVALNRLIYRHRIDPNGYSPLNPQRISELGLRNKATLRGLARRRPMKNGFQVRCEAIRRYDPGSSNKSILGGWGIDRRDPTSDIRLIEYTLSIPTEEFLQAGTPRALARSAFSDRLPEIILKEERRGLQAADWHEKMTEERDHIAAEIERLSSCPATARTLNIPKLQEMIGSWPDAGWEKDEVIHSYRVILASAISTGHFMRRVIGSNA